ncbi:MAG: hypothetical protein FGF52_01030 [Candidatus Brockarchaeota archaeon]|nr:hypothetical protein [Candidatus Brockarchaeota archaeon]
MEVVTLRELKRLSLIISGVIAILSLLAASGLMLITIGSGTPGTWKGLTGEDKLFGGAMSIWVLAEGRYDSQGTRFDYAFHSASRSMPSGLWSLLITPVKLKITMTRNYDTYTKTFNDATTGGYAELRAGSFWRVCTEGESVYTYNLVPWAPATYTLRASAGVEP